MAAKLAVAIGQSVAATVQTACRIENELNSPSLLTNALTARGVCKLKEILYLVNYFLLRLY